MSDEAPKCHCSHVVVIETKMTIVAWFIAVLFAGVISVMISKVTDLVSLRIKSDPIWRSGERLGSDRIPEPTP
jgi:hypothetical protein